MAWVVSAAKAASVAADLLVVGVPEGERGPDLDDLGGLAGALAGGLAAVGDGAVFTGKRGTDALLPGERCAARWVLLTGLGPRAELSAQRLRCAAGLAAAQARRQKAQRCAVLPPAGGVELDPAAVARCWTEGAELALGELPRLTAGAAETAIAAAWAAAAPPPAPSAAAAGPGQAPFAGPSRWELLAPRRGAVAAMERGVAQGLAYAEGCRYARRLVNLPANVATPRHLAEAARLLAREHGYACRVLGRTALARAGMGGMLGVARGSAEEPRLIVLESPPDGARAARGRRAGRPDRRPLVALVGKGVTFDSGGLSLKTAASMEIMKYDMAGAAAVLGAALTVARLGLPARLLVVVPAVENLPGGRALKPGDVITTAAGKTVEVLNTDAEGRVVLADALHYACGRRPDYLVDAATLTGACHVALGDHFAGVMGTSARLLELLERAGGETFERVWPLPLVEEHHEAVKSEVADLKNTGPREGGALWAAAFLAAFVDERVPWAHVDLAGPAWQGKAGPLGPRGATGYGARLLARLVELLVS